MEAEERRTSPRYHLGECGYLEVLGGLDRNRQEVYIADISRGGLGLHLDRALAAGSTVQVSLSKCTIEGVVAHCQPSDDGFFVGIRANKAAIYVEKLRRSRRQVASNTSQEAERFRVEERTTFLGVRIRRRRRLEN